MDDKSDKSKPGDEVLPGTAQSGEAPCPACGGSGRLNGTECAACSGTGTVTALVGDA